MIGPVFDMFTAAMFISSSARFLNMCKPRIGWPTSIDILWIHRLARFHPIGNFLVNGIYLFQGCPIKQAAFLPGQPAPYNYFRKMLNLGFWKFKPIFLRIQFSLVATFFSLFLVICLSWYLHLTLSHEFLTFISFNIWR